MLMASEVSKSPIKAAVTVIEWLRCVRCPSPSNRIATGTAIQPIAIIHAPPVTASAFPPRNRRKGDHACPIIGESSRTAHRSSDVIVEGNSRYWKAAKRGMAPLPISRTKDVIPGIWPPSFQVLAVPGLPSPMDRISFCRNNFPTSNAHGMAPLIKATGIQKR